MMQLSSRLSGLEGSLSVGFADTVRKLESEGQKILKLQTGDPDFPTAPSVVAAAQKALAEGQTKYCQSQGLPDLRAALSEKLARENGIRVNPATEILVTHGAVAGVSIALQSVVSEGDEVIILAPYWRAYASDTVLAGGRPVFVELSKENDFQPTMEKIRTAHSSRTKAILINTPNNPTGAVYSESFLRELVEWTVSKNIFLISDEVYESYIYVDKKHVSPASLVKENRNIISLYSFSKTYAMTGWRVGYLAAPAALVTEMLKISQYNVTSLAPYSQIAAKTALTDASASAAAKHMHDVCAKNVELLKKRFAGSWLEKRVSWPEGAIYAMIDFRDLGKASADLAIEVVAKSQVALTPGTAFGEKSEGFLRLCFAFSTPVMEEAATRLLALDGKLGK